MNDKKKRYEVRTIVEATSSLEAVNAAFDNSPGHLVVFVSFSGGAEETHQVVKAFTGPVTEGVDAVEVVRDGLIKLRDGSFKAWPEGIEATVILSHAIAWLSPRLVTVSSTDTMLEDEEFWPDEDLIDGVAIDLKGTLPSDVLDDALNALDSDEKV